MRSWLPTTTLLLCIVLVAGTRGGELTTAQRQKLHPAFQHVLSTPSIHSPSIAVIPSEDQSMTRYLGIVTTSSPDLIRATGVRVNSEYPGFVTIDATAEQIAALATMDAVSFIEPGTENYPATDVSVPATGASLLHAGFVNSTSYNGSGVIVLVYDTGIDFFHKDFRKPDTTKSRILAIWDQTLTAGAGETTPAGFTYGVEYTQTQIENELDGTPPGFVREKDINGHGTHVTGTAAGNGNALGNRYVGMAP